MNGRNRKPWLATALVLALALALAGTAVAAGVRWGALDFLSAKEHAAQALPEARNALQTELLQEGGVTDWASFVLREALCDGRYAWLVFDVVPAEADTLLVAEGMSPNAPAKLYSPELPEDVTLAQWAQDNGYARIMLVTVEPETASGNGAGLGKVSWHSEADGAVSLMLWTAYGAEASGKQSFICSVMPWRTGEASPRAPQETTLKAELEPGPEPLWTLEWTGAAALPDSDIVVERISLVGSVVSMYCEITYSAPETERLYSWVYPVNEQGKRLARSAGTTTLLNDGVIRSGEWMNRLEDGRFLSFGSYAPLTEPPEVLWVSGVVMEEDRWLETVEIRLK